MQRNEVPVIQLDSTFSITLSNADAAAAALAAVL